MLTITDTLLLAGSNGPGGWCAKQLAVLGVEWPPPRGWKSDLIGNQIPQGIYEKFLRLRRIDRQEKALPSKNPQDCHRFPSMEVIGRNYKPSDDKSCPF